jgi:uncharacterized protein (TIGR03086 family)
MDATDQAIVAVDLLTPLVEGTRPEQLTEATPCSKWTVRDLMNHFIGGGHMFAGALRGDPLPTGEPPDLVGDDHVVAFTSAAEDFRSAVDGLGSLAQPAELPIGTVPADMALRIAAGDLLVHCWDLARSTGQPFDPPEHFVIEADAFYRAVVTPELRQAELFGPEVEPPADASALDRLVAFAGRQP